MLSGVIEPVALTSLKMLDKYFLDSSSTLQAQGQEAFQHIGDDRDEEKIY